MPFRADNPKNAYTLVEMLVVIAIVVILAALTVGTLRATRTHQVLEQSAGKIELLLESAKAHAVTHGVSVLLVTPAPESSPGGIGLRAFTLVREQDGHIERLRDWDALPRGIALAPDPHLPDGDLMADALREVPAPVPDAGNGPNLPTGPLRVLVEVSPGGRFYTGTDPRPRPAHITLARGEWFSDATGTWRFDNGGAVDAMRVHLRPLTGMTQSERVEAP